MAAVVIRNVEKAFGATKVIHGVSVEIADGEFVCWSAPRAAASPRCCA